MTVETATLTESATGASAKVMVGFGFNCFEFRPVVEGRAIDVLWSAAEFEDGGGRPSGSGIPILFPFPGRIQGTRMHWQGETYTLEEGDGQGNAIHGFVHCRPWRVVEQQDDAVTGQFQASLDDPSLLERWPADFCITATYRLEGNALISHLMVENPGETPLPCGLGTHPYFRVPLGGGDAATCEVEVPVGQRWQLEGMIATGKRLPLEAEQQLGEGRKFGELTLDAGFSDIRFAGDWCTASIRDPGSGRAMVMRFDRAFRECVVYNPPHREAICIEPYTCICDPFRLEALGIDAGLRVVEPGGSFSANVEMRVE